MSDFLEKELELMKRPLLIISFLLVWLIGIQAQTRNAFLTAGEEAFQAKDYYSALYYYQQVLEFEAEDINVLYRAAEAARLFNSYNLAEKYYTNVVDMERNGEYPLATFWLAEMKKNIGKYEEAKEKFQMYLSENELDNPYYTEVASQQIDDCDWALEQMQNPRDYVSVERLGETVNTPYSEFGPVRIGDTLYYSSLRFESKLDKSNPRRIFSKVLTSIKGSEGAEIDSTFNDKKLHTAHNVFSENKDRVYYTICEYLNAQDIRCDIFYRNISNGVFGAPVALPFNDSLYTSTQPALGMDPDGHMPALYFVSDRDGGRGKLDIWYAKINPDGSFGDPVNLSPVNSEEDDITPFYHAPSSTLYFSSEGYQGFGGFDVYGVYTGNMVNPYIENLGTPVNSSYNDIYYYLEESEDTAYLSSNRKGSLYLEEAQEACCNDIFKATFSDLDINLKSLVFDQATRSDLLGATVTLMEVNGEEKIIDSQSADNTNEFVFPLERNRSYKVIAEKDGYFPDTIMISTRGINESEDITKRHYLKSKALDLELFVFDGETKEELRGATVKLNDLSEPGNEVVVQINEEGNSFVFPLDRNKSYEIITSKKGYKPDTLVLSTVDIPGSRLTKNIYLHIGNLEDFLPLAVYFDNDYPNPDTYYRTTRKTYDDTYPPYLDKKEEFKTEFTDPLIGNSKVQAEDEIERFFEYDIREGRNNLVKFLQILYDELEKGEELEIVIQGFASPRAPSSYNDRLSSRRISSILNQFRRYANGVLRPYQNSGQLKIIQEPLGETKAPIYVSDDYKDTRNSIYSVPASRERRVEIINVRRAND